MRFKCERIFVSTKSQKRACSDDRDGVGGMVANMRCAPARPVLPGADRTPGAPTPVPELNEAVGVPVSLTSGENGASKSAAAVVDECTGGGRCGGRR